MTTILRRKWPSKLIPVVLAVAALGGVGVRMAYDKLYPDCCYPGSPCCYPGSPCCEASKHASR